MRVVLRAMKSAGRFFRDHLRRIMIGVAGTIVLLVGLAMVVLPGPAIVVIPLGVAILATEFVFARRWFVGGRRKVRPWARAGKQRARNVWMKLRGRNGKGQMANGK